MRGLRYFSAVALVCMAGLHGSIAVAADDDAIQRAIKRGVESLKRSQGGDGSWVHKENPAGSTALAGVTLLECEVDSADPSIQKAADYLRREAILLNHTYSISLCLMFFDRLGDPQDDAMIETLAIRLLAGQSASGGWAYQCPVDSSRSRALANDYKKRAKPEGNNTGGASGNEAIPNAGGQLPGAGGEGGGGFQPGDNSNTQFATIALWVARRHKVATERALLGVEDRYRNSQNQDGGWGYVPAFGPAMGMARGGKTSPAMTCAGLIGLAVGYGVKDDVVLRTEANAKLNPKAPKPKLRLPDPKRDAAVVAGFGALVELLAGPFSLAQRSGMGGMPAQQGGGMQAGMGADTTDYYLLWSLERVAMVYDLKTLDHRPGASKTFKFDWYDWGSKIILARQRGEGSWAGMYVEGGVDTCFALLFLRRSNRAHDLSSHLRGKLQAPSEVSLKSGDGASSLPGGDKAKTGSKEKSSTLPKLDLEGITGGPDDPNSGNPKFGGTGRSGNRLAGASPAEQDALIEKLKDGKGPENTSALASVIPQLSGAVKTKARDALAERLSRMKATTLRDKMQDEDLEIRRAAALAGAMKEEKQLVPDLIKLLNDPEPPVARASLAALKALTGKDFGPGADSSRAEKALSITKWNDWWRSSGDK